MAAAEEQGGFSSPSDLNYASLSEAQKAVADAAWEEAGQPGGSPADFWDGLSWGMRASYFPDDQQIEPSNNPNATSDGNYVPGGTNKPSGAGDDPYYAVEENRRVRGGQAPPKMPDPEPDAAPADTTGEPPVYNDDGMAADTGGGGGDYTPRSSGGGGGGSSRSSGGGGGGGGGGGQAAQPAMSAPSFGSSPNNYPTLPMTAIRRQTLQNLSGAFGPNVGTFRTPPGGWRADMAPMFTSGAFGGVGGGGEPAPQPAGGNMFMGGGSLPGGPPPSQGAAPALPTLPDPNAIPPELAMGLAPQDAPPPGMGMGMGMPSFSQPGFVAPGSPYDMQMQRVRQQQGGNAAPLPPSLRQRFGL